MAIGAIVEELSLKVTSGNPNNGRITTFAAFLHPECCEKNLSSNSDCEQKKARHWLWVDLTLGY